MSEECWVCLRITPALVLKFAHQLWKDPKVAREIGLKALNIMAECYNKKPIFFSGRPAKSLVGSLFYVLGVQCNFLITQRAISQKLEVTEVALRTNYKRWIKEFPDVFIDLDLIVKQLRIPFSPGLAGKEVTSQEHLTWKGKWIHTLVDKRRQKRS